MAEHGELIRDSIALLEAIRPSTDLTAISAALHECILQGGKIMFFGNGGSAADAQHLTAECLIQLRKDRPRDPIPAICLSMDPSTLTACGNDLGYDRLFERSITALGRRGDVAFGLSTSGNSTNVIRALKRAREIGLTTIGLLGSGGGAALEHCDHAIVVPSETTAAIQIAHITIAHQILFDLEDLLLVDATEVAEAW